MKIATIGTGFIVDSFLQSALKIEGIILEACYSRSLNKAQDLQKRYHINKVYDQLLDLYQDKDIDCIYIASPNSLHYYQAKEALNHHKHVILEKPFCSNVQQAKELVELARGHHLFLFEAITNIHKPLYQKLKSYLHTIGNIKCIQCNYSQYSSRYDAFQAGALPNVFNPEFSGGALVDINIYNLHFVMNCFGKPQQVHYYPHIERGIDTSGVAILEYETFFVSCIGAKDANSENYAMIQGDLGYIKVDGANSCRRLDIYSQGNHHVDEVDDDFNNLYHELNDFYQAYSRQDFTYCYQLLDYSLDVMQVLDDLRKDGNIVFKDNGGQL